MTKLENFLSSVSWFNVNIDTDTLGYYWYKVELMWYLLGTLQVILIVVWVLSFLYLYHKYYWNNG